MRDREGEDHSEDGGNTHGGMGRGEMDDMGG